MLTVIVSGIEFFQIFSEYFKKIQLFEGVVLKLAGMFVQLSSTYLYSLVMIRLVVTDITVEINCLIANVNLFFAGTGRETDEKDHHND